MRLSIIFVIATGLLLSACGTVNNKTTTAINPNKILPEYANPSTTPLSAMIESTHNITYFLSSRTRLTTEDPLEGISQTGKWKINGYNPNQNTIKLTALSIDYQNQNPSAYPLLTYSLLKLIPEQFNRTGFVNPYADLVNPITLNPSAYNLRTLQDNNLEVALENSALLRNRKNIKTKTSAEILKERATYLDVAQKSLQAMYKKNPALKAKFESAVAFGVFDVTNFNILLYVGAYGKGVIFDNKQRKVLYMDTVRAGTGPGLGYEDMYIVFVFKSEFALEQFIGAEGGGADIGASATLGVVGGQISFNPQIDVYQLHRNGFDLQANWGGTIYMPASSLND